MHNFKREEILFEYFVFAMNPVQVKKVVKGQHWCDTRYKKYLSNGENAEEKYSSCYWYHCRDDMKYIVCLPKDL